MNTVHIRCEQCGALMNQTEKKLVGNRNKYNRRRFKCPVCNIEKTTFNDEALQYEDHEIPDEERARNKEIDDFFKEENNE